MRTALLLLGGVALAFGAAVAPVSQAPYEVYAIRYGVLPAFPASGLIAGEDKARTLDIPVMFWLLKGSDGRRVLVDSGFHQQRFIERWKPRDYRSPADAVRAAGVAPEDITDIVITHAHWDHAGGADLFPKATVWIQREEYEYYLGEAWHARDTHGGVDAEDMAALLRINTEGRLRFVEGDDQEPLPGVRCYLGGRHTRASQYVGVRAEGGTVVLASDNVYLYENLERGMPIAQTWDAASNLAAQARIRTLAAGPAFIVPGHDPLVFERYPRVAEGVVRVK